MAKKKTKKDEVKKKEVNIFSIKQLKVIDKYAPEEIKEMAKSGKNVEEVKKWLNETLTKQNEEKLKEEYNNPKLSINQLRVVDKYAPEEIKEMTKSGNNIEEVKEWLNETLTKQNEEKLIKEYGTDEFTVKQLKVIDKYAPEEIKEKLKTEGATEEVYKWFDKARKEYIEKIYVSNLEKNYGTENFSIKQLKVIDNYAPEEIKEMAKSGKNVEEVKKWLNETLTKQNEEKLKEEYNNPKLTINQLKVVDKYAPEEIKEMVKNEGATKDVYQWINESLNKKYEEKLTKEYSGAGSLKNEYAQVEKDIRVSGEKVENSFSMKM